MIIFDENVDQILIDSILEAGFECVSVANSFKGISDKAVIQLALDFKKSIIVTEDKDFGELVFAHKMEGFSVVLLRYIKSERPQIENNLISVLRKITQLNETTFSTITAKNIRIRRF